ncbi:signal transduction histidine kinase [Micrococcus cohnii]|uniref:histidine kinase n=1 Tax=Micrococcus cohnii TaxID=993416 RepID=A0A7W7M3X3_9MICC|nr:sensor histidine kinase [Micrococcus cohnii]MBB4736097.1 signal transduction histidine kinase [Micrococcus cohnii]
MPASARALPPTWRRTDWIVAGILALASIELTYLADFVGTIDPKHSVHTSAAAAAATSLVLAWRRSRPLLVGVLVSLAYVTVAVLLGLEPYASQVVLFLGVYSIGAWCPDRRRAFLTRTGIVVVMTLWLLYSFVDGFHDPDTGERGVNAYLAFTAIMTLTNIAYFTGAWMFGDRSWAQAIERQHLAAAHAEIRAQQGQLQEQAVRLERLRIARELHDVVAHHVTAMGVQAGAARMLIDRAPGEAAEHLRHVEASSRSAVQELQTMVHTLRDDDASAESLPCLDDLPALVAEADALGGQRVRFERVDARPVHVDAVDGPGALPARAAQLALFRVAQEGLTNARKHAGPRADVVVRLRLEPTRTEVEVSDDGRGCAATPTAGTRMGLVGMREGMDSVGGGLEAGPKPDGGWLVRATVAHEPPRDDEGGRA